MRGFKILLSILLVLTLTACGGKENNGKEVNVLTELKEPVELVIWNTYTEHHAKAFNAIVDKFNQSQDMVKVTVQTQSYQDFEAKLLQAVRNQTGPDIVSAFPTAVGAYIDEDLVVDFAPYINHDKIGIPTFKDDLVGEIYGEITQWDPSKIYMIPVIATSEVLYYNQTWYDELNLKVPTTWEELEENSRKIYAAKGVPGFGTDSAVDTWQGLIKQAGSGYINPETKTVEFDNDIALEQLTWFANCVNEGIFRLVGEDFYFSNPFGSQAVGSYIGSSAGVDYALGAAGDRFKVGCAPIPQMGKGNDYISSWGGGYIAFKSTDEKALAAYTFLKYLSSPEVSAEWCIAFGAIPPYKSAAELPVYQAYLETNIAAKAMYEEMDAFSWLNSIPGSSGVRTYIDKMVEEACTNLKTPEQALKDCVDSSNQELAQY